MSTIQLTKHQFLALCPISGKDDIVKLTFFENYIIATNENNTIFSSVTNTSLCCKIHIHTKSLLDYKLALGSTDDTSISICITLDKLTFITSTIPDYKIDILKYKTHNESHNEYSNNLDSFYNFIRGEFYTKYDREKQILIVDASKSPDFSNENNVELQHSETYLEQVLEAISNSFQTNN